MHRIASMHPQGRSLSASRKVPTTPRRPVRAVRAAPRAAPRWLGTRPAAPPAALCAAAPRRRAAAAAARVVTTQAVAVRFMFPNARVR